MNDYLTGCLHLCVCDKLYQGQCIAVKCGDYLPDTWKSVRDDPPKEEGEYNVYFENRNEYYSQQAFLYYYPEEREWHMKGQAAPTHWQPLPPPPAGKGSKADSDLSDYEY